MGIRENTIITKTFTYDLPDDYLYQTNANGLTGSFTYTGPDKIWVLVDQSTGLLSSNLMYTEKDDGDNIPTPPGIVKVMITAEDDPILISMIYNNGNDYSSLPQKTEALPDGSSYSRPDPTPPDHTYELMEIQYDVTSGTWVKPFPWKKPHMSWEELKKARTALLLMSDTKLATSVFTDAEKAEWETYRQALRDLPVTFDGVDPWKVPFPEEPVGGA